MLSRLLIKSKLSPGLKRTFYAPRPGISSSTPKQKALNNSLLLNCALGYSSKVEQLLTTGADPNFHYNSCLRIAVGSGHVETIQKLLNDPRTDPVTPNNILLHQAIQKYTQAISKSFNIMDPSILSKALESIKSDRKSNLKSSIKHDTAEPVEYYSNVTTILRYSHIISILLNDSRVRNSLTPEEYQEYASIV